MRSSLLPAVILAALAGGLGFAWWYEQAHPKQAPAPAVHEPGAEDGAACAHCAGEDEPAVPAAGLLQVVGDVPEFTFKNQDGQEFGLADLRGHVWVADFIFTRCSGPCPAMTVSMKTLQDRSEDLKGLHMVTFTVDPNDSVEDLHRYAAGTDADTKRWTFLKGPPEELKQLVVDGFHLGSKSDPLNHSTRFVLVDQTGRIRGYYDHRRGDEMIRLRKHVHLLLTGERL